MSPETSDRRRHRRRALVVWCVGLAVVLVVAAFVGPAVYAGLVNRHADPVPTLGTGSASVGAAGPLADGRWTVGAGSFAGYRVHEVLQGHDATVTGRTDEIAGAVTVSGGRVTAATVTVQVASVRTDEPPRDSYFRSTALETSRFPTATFVLARAVPASTGAVSLSGRLTVHGVTRDVTFAGRASTGSAGAEVVASLPVNWADYGVDAPRLPFVTVDDRGAIELDLHLARSL